MTRWDHMLYTPQSSKGGRPGDAGSGTAGLSNRVDKPVSSCSCFFLPLLVWGRCGRGSLDEGARPCALWAVAGGATPLAEAGGSSCNGSCQGLPLLPC